MELSQYLHAGEEWKGKFIQGSKMETLKETFFKRKKKKSAKKKNTLVKSTLIAISPLRE